MPEITFALASPDNLSELLGMMRELQADDPWSCPFDEQVTARVTGDLLRDPALGRIWLVSADGQIVGYIVMCFDYSLEYRGRGAWIDEFFVRRSHRGRGIGTDVLQFFADEARNLGITVVHLEVNHGNPAVELYRRLGFEDHHRYLMTRWILEKP